MNCFFTRRVPATSQEVRTYSFQPPRSLAAILAAMLSQASPPAAVPYTYSNGKHTLFASSSVAKIGRCVMCTRRFLREPHPLTPRIHPAGIFQIPSSGMGKHDVLVDEEIDYESMRGD